MPFGSYEESPAVAFRNAATIMSESGASAVKIEGGREMADTIGYLVARGIPVMGHVGLMPQSVHASGGFAAQGRDEAGAKRILDDARAVADAGAFSIVVEGTVEPLAAEITRSIDVPTIGIGASVACDGQILVTEDLVGLFMDFTPKFVKRYAMLGEQIAEAGRRFAEDVRARRFPADEHTFAMKPRPAAAADPDGDDG
jgi:3-methyl-2-oxobutanoate hydroxymethyltransferase